MKGKRAPHSLCVLVLYVVARWSDNRPYHPLQPRNGANILHGLGGGRLKKSTSDSVVEGENATSSEDGIGGGTIRPNEFTFFAPQ